MVPEQVEPLQVHEIKDEQKFWEVISEQSKADPLCKNRAKKMRKQENRIDF